MAAELGRLRRAWARGPLGPGRRALAGLLRSRRTPLALFVLLMCCGPGCASTTRKHLDAGQLFPACLAANEAGAELEREDRLLLSTRLLEAVPYRVFVEHLSKEQAAELVGEPVPFLYSHRVGQGLWRVRVELAKGPHGATVRLRAPHFYRHSRPVVLDSSPPTPKTLEGLLKPPRAPYLPRLPTAFVPRTPKDEAWVGGRSAAGDVLSAVTLGLLRPGPRRKETRRERRRRLARFRKSEARRREHHERRRQEVVQRREKRLAAHTAAMAEWQRRLQAVQRVFRRSCEGGAQHDEGGTLELPAGSSCEWLTWSRPRATIENNGWGMGLSFRQRIELTQGAQRCARSFVWRVPLGNSRRPVGAALGALLPAGPPSLSELPGKSERLPTQQLTR